jgi:uncharacterized protein involved in exopolysaccharide biosynthesis
METHNTNNNIDNNDLDLREIFKALWMGKFTVISVTTFFIIASIIYSLSLPNIYHSRAILSPVGESSGNGMSQMMKNMGGLASLAGVNLSAGDSGSKTLQAIEKLNTLSFFENNILPNIHLPDLMAIESWDANVNDIIYDPEIYDEVTKTWTREYSYPETLIPSAQESFDVFGAENLVVFQDIDTGFVSITVKHQSPYVAQSWAELIVSQLNYFFRAKSKLEAQAAMDYLNTQMAQTSFSEIKLVIAQLLQQKMQQLTLIEASDFYVFEYIDPPAAMENKSEPSRAAICIIGAILGGLLGCLIAVVRYYSSGKDIS